MAFSILLIEDSVTDTKLTVNALNEFGRQHAIDLNIDVVQDGAEAITYLFNGSDDMSQLNAKPDLIMLDLKMPIISGFELLEKIKSTLLSEKIPVVVFTALKGPTVFEDCVHLKADDLITKPVDNKEFTKVIAEMGNNWILPRL